MKEVSPELTRQVLQPAMHAKLLLRAAELVTKGWTRGTAARDADSQKVRSTAPQATHVNRQWSPPRGAGSPLSAGSAPRAATPGIRAPTWPRPGWKH